MPIGMEASMLAKHATTVATLSAKMHTEGVKGTITVTLLPSECYHVMFDM